MTRIDRPSTIGVTMIQKVFIVVMAIALGALWLLTFLLTALRGGRRKKK